VIDEGGVVDVSVGLKVSACNARPSAVTLLVVDVVVVVGGDVVDAVAVVVDDVKCVVDLSGCHIEEFRSDVSVGPESRWALPA